MALKRKYQDYRKLAKRANQRLREMEKHPNELSPAYYNAQAYLEMSGVKKDGQTGRRFSEKVNMTWNEYQHMMKAVVNFLGSKTSTVSGFKKYKNTVWETANKNFNLSDSGITKEQYFDFWKNYPDKEKDRMYGSQVVINILNTYSWVNGKRKREEQLTGEEIANLIQKSNNYKEALRSLGLSIEDIKDYETASKSDRLLGGSNAKSKSKNRKRK